MAKTIRQAVKNVIGRIRLGLTPESQTASYDLNSGTATAGSKSSSAPTASGATASKAVTGGGGPTTRANPTPTRPTNRGGGGPTTPQDNFSTDQNGNPVKISNFNSLPPSTQERFRNQQDAYIRSRASGGNSRGFSGSVAEYNNRGIAQNEKSYVNGRFVGQVNYNPRKVGSQGSYDVYDVSPGNVTAEVKRPAKITYDRDGTRREVTFSKEGIQSETTTTIGDVEGQAGQEIFKSTVEPSVRPSGLAGIRYDFTTAQATLRTRSDRGSISIKERSLLFGIGFSTAIIDTASGVKSLFTHPIETIKSLPGATTSELKNIGTSVSQGTPELGFGRVAGLLVGDKAIRGITEATTKVPLGKKSDISEVKVAGVATQVADNKVISEGVFRVSRGRTQLKGIFSSKSIQNGNGEAVISVTKVKTFKSGVEFPTGRTVISDVKTFRSAEIARVTERDGLFMTTAVGSTRSGRLGTTKSSYRAGGISKQFNFKGDEFVAQIGGSISRPGKERALSFGFLKIKQSLPPSSFEVVNSGGPLSLKRFMKTNTKALSAASLSAVKSSVSSAVKVPKATTIPLRNIFPTSQSEMGTKITQVTRSSLVVKTDTISTKEFTTIKLTSLTTSQMQTLSIKNIQNLKLAPRQRTNQRSSTIFNQTQPQASATQFKTIFRTLQETLPRQTQPQLFKFRTLQVSRQRQTQASIFKTPIPRFPSPKFVLPIQKRTKQSRSTGGNFSVFLRRFGTFYQIGSAKSPQKAFSIGKSAAGRTLAATFRVSGTSNKAFKVPGFYTKQTKQGPIFIELPKYRLSTGSEIAEIQSYRRNKR